MLPAVVEGVVGDPVPPSTISHQLDSVEVWTQCFICQKKSQLLSADSEQFYSVEKTRAQVNPAAVGTERLLRDILEDVIADLNPRIRVGSLPWTRDDYVCSKCFRLLTQYLSLSQQLHLVEQALKKEIGSEKLKLWEGGGDMVEADKGILQLEAESESLPRKRWRKRKAGEEPDDHPDQKRLELEDELEMQESSFPSEANSRIVWDLRPEAVRVLEGKDQERKGGLGTC